ncbi:MAG: SulP family inorganic anion transporter [Cyclobacteriaceae bacterium]
MRSRISSLLQNTRYDIPAGLVVFLVALPLCLGIALASGAPLVSGLVTGIVGGLVVALLSGSHLAVSGPAAGLTVIVLDGIEKLGTFEAFLAAVVLAGAMQLVLGFLRAGVIGYYFPSSVIKGMLAAIGLILILKQIPHFLGVDSDFFGVDAFVQMNGKNTFSEIAYTLGNPGWGPMVIGMISLGIILLWKTSFIRRNKVLSGIPSALLVVIVTVLVNQLFLYTAPVLAITAEHLVRIPALDSLGALQSELSTPDFTQLFNIDTFRIAITIAIIASLETLLSIEATDKLDIQKRRTPTNRELKAQGVGNMLAGLIGGIPMTAVIVRSSANISAGAKSKMSAFYHGFFLLVCVMLIPDILNLIPLSALAAILLDVGFKLTRPALYKSQWRIGREQFIPFIVTVVAILFTDLLVGISIGMAVGVYFILRNNYNTPFQVSEENKETHSHYTIHLSEHVSFLNKANITSILDKISQNSVVDIYGDNTKFIDYDIVEAINEFRETADEKNIRLSLINLPTNVEKGLADH